MHALTLQASAHPEPSAEAGVPSRFQSTSHATRLRATVANHFSFVWRSLRNLGVAQGDVDDAAQQVFLVLSQKLDAVPSGQERAFLFGTAVRIASRARRTRNRRREVSELPAQVDPAPDPEESLDRSQERAWLDEILQRLEPDLRSVFILFAVEDLTVSEISNVLGIPRGTAASRLRRAREEFRGHVRRLEAQSRSYGGSK